MKSTYYKEKHRSFRSC